MRRRRLLAVRLIILHLFLLVIIAPEWPAYGDQAHQLDTIVGMRQFEFLTWELRALGAKAEASLTNGHSYLDERSRRDIVLSYLDLVREVARLENDIVSVFADPEIMNPNVAARDQQAELADKREAQRLVQSTAEAIVQDQIANVLVDEGFHLMGQAWPPVLMHMTPLPSVLIVSPRDRIERIYGIPLMHGLRTAEKEELESSVFENLDLSGLVVSLGGLGTYPAMIIETGSIVRLAEVTAHEWAHHWLAPYPVTLNYLEDRQVRTMNETIASIVGNEIGEIMIERYYPEFAPTTSAVEQPAVDTDSAVPDEPPAFDFQVEMALTRENVDRLLAEGKIDEAEAYMEERRLLLVENGWAIRKLNQAYFAFFGAYADVPGEAGSDPIGPMLLEIRSRSDSLKDFMQTVAPIGSFKELETVLEIVSSGG